MEPKPRGREHRKRVAKSRAEAWRLGGSEDLEMALEAAERLLHQAEERHRHEQNRSIAIISIIAGALLSLFASLVIVFQFVDYLTTGGGAVAVVSTVVTSLVLVQSGFSLYRQRQRMQQDFTLRLATQLSAIIREAMVDIADREDWSYLRQEATKIRLSAFPLLDTSDTR